MTLTTFMTLLASVMALALSTGVCLVVVRLLRQSRLSSSAALSARLSETESALELLTTQVKGIRSRLSMQSLREKRRESTEQTETLPEDVAQADRDRLNSQLAAQLRGRM